MKSGNLEPKQIIGRDTFPLANQDGLHGFCVCLHASLCVTHCFLPKRGFLSVPIYFRQSIFRWHSVWWVRFSEWFQDCAHYEPLEALMFWGSRFPFPGTSPKLYYLPHAGVPRRPATSDRSLYSVGGGVIAETEQRPSYPLSWRGGQFDKLRKSFHFLSVKVPLSFSFATLSYLPERKREYNISLSVLTFLCLFSAMEGDRSSSERPWNHRGYVGFDLTSPF